MSAILWFAATQKAMPEVIDIQPPPSDQEVPIDVILHCPTCKKQHIDEGEWATRPHRTHQCVDDAAGKGCGMAFTPCAKRTFGVVKIEKDQFRALSEPPGFTPRLFECHGWAIPSGQKCPECGAQVPL